MLKISSIANLFSSATLTTTLVLTTIVSYPSKTLSQTPTNGQNATSQPGCLSGYPDNTYQGSQPVTRYEFAAGLNACLNQLNQLTPANKANLATKEDLEILLQRQRKLNEQVQELNQRVDSLRKN
ncbi:S-layer homology domain-containing protein [Nostocaceae cyanobacterium CENA357]|uniref:S-layer homology domain-containing protein n=1 Tax=Atlanticothrix silvestris CENA357 TaxID=1725252 RepID=A0A8J7HIY3_9CYAN|nr:S-layer homology domain-containing protein [Atlanticothrix silvestris]MBH8555916.1 S-layer homology domain-containing protein [Atlanticothrix silvestris CENA357]